MRKVKLFIATSLDSYIAGPNGEIDWLFADGDFGYSAFIQTVDTTLMGNETYKLTQSLGEFPYQSLTNYVFTRNSDATEAPYVKFISGDITAFVADLKQQPGKDIFLVGGGQINALLLDAGLIDELQVFVHPISLGKGIPLFQPTEKRHPWRFVSSRSFERGLIELRYVKA
ncbi:dihydrofolate reductase [Larkinella arboricola]|uniref:Dihydrofolate reductase n=1 Tax=Larkinella arboricola TaxID=643671 RepID=A0A327WTU1_LARAB|nr:dihydrofolate reductase family protein [Larkinella arboricola]RAJ94441.1 dihydrofolate reductase [Larkinella arboricola]